MSAAIGSSIQVQGARSDLPVSVIAVGVKPLRAEANLSQKRLLALSKYGVLPVVNRKKQLVGLLRYDDVASVATGVPLAERLNGSVSDWMAPLPVCLKKNSTVKEALTGFEVENTLSFALLPIEDAQGRYTGTCASYSLACRLMDGQLRPTRVGGLATPLGVYMTSGRYSAGSGWKGLVSTGVMFGILFHVIDWLGLVGYSATVAVFPALMGLEEWQQLFMQVGFSMVCLFAFMRFTPMSGLHAAEHMTINAMEKGLPLTDDQVRCQPREHARCGTNLMVFLSGVQLLGVFLYVSYHRLNPVGVILYAVFWTVLIFKFWRPVGLWMQRHFTTRDPSAAELSSGIQAGEELLNKFSAMPHAMPSFWERLWGAGLFHMLASCAVTAWLVGLLLERLGL